MSYPDCSLGRTPKEGGAQPLRDPSTHPATRCQAEHTRPGRAHPEQGRSERRIGPWSAPEVGDLRQAVQLRGGSRCWGAQPAQQRVTSRSAVRKRGLAGPPPTSAQEAVRQGWITTAWHAVSAQQTTVPRKHACGAQRFCVLSRPKTFSCGWFPRSFCVSNLCCPQKPRDDPVKKSRHPFCKCRLGNQTPGAQRTWRQGECRRAAGTGQPG